MEKKKMAKALMMTAALAGGITVAQSFFNEAQASDCFNFDVRRVFYNGSYHYECQNNGQLCRIVPVE